MLEAIALSASMSRSMISPIKLACYQEITARSHGRQLPRHDQGPVAQRYAGAQRRHRAQASQRRQPRYRLADPPAVTPASARPLRRPARQARASTHRSGWPENCLRPPHAPTGAYLGWSGRALSRPPVEKMGDRIRPGSSRVGSPPKARQHCCLALAPAHMADGMGVDNPRPTWSFVSFPGPPRPITPGRRLRRPLPPDAGDVSGTSRTSPQAAHCDQHDTPSRNAIQDRAFACRAPRRPRSQA